MDEKKYKLAFIADNGTKVKMVDMFVTAKSKRHAREIQIGLASNWDGVESEELVDRANPTYRTAKNTVECHQVELA